MFYQSKDQLIKTHTPEIPFKFIKDQFLRNTISDIFKNITKELNDPIIHHADVNDEVESLELKLHVFSDNTFKQIVERLNGLKTSDNTKEIEGILYVLQNLF